MPEDQRAHVTRLFELPKLQIPYSDRALQYVATHGPPPPSAPALEVPPLLAPNPDFLAAFQEFTGPDGTTQLPFPPVPAREVKAIPSQWSDHVFPRSGGPGKTNTDPNEFITSATCIGCHGGLGGSPYPLTMFVKTGPLYGEGFNVAEYGEWRWSPMGLAGRDPIFHAQLESEMIILAKNANRLKFAGSLPDVNDPLTGSLGDNQRALANTCLSCHGAMGERQLKIDSEAGRKLPSGEPLERDFNPDYFYLTEALTTEQLNSPPQPPSGEVRPDYHYEDNEDYYGYHKYGELAREGISCAICHRINPPDPAAVESFVRKSPTSWLPELKWRKWKDEFVYFLAKNTTGQFTRSPANVLNGPFGQSNLTGHGDDTIVTLPMQNALGITPQYNAFTSDSKMCGTCHVINLPNIGSYPSYLPVPEPEYPVLKKIENVAAFQPYAHSIEQATYLEWLNSDFGPGADNQWKDTFKSCQDCHMPGGLNLPRQDIEIPQLTTKMATIMDTDLPDVGNAAPAEQFTVKHHDDFRRHELVGLNVFLLEMAAQFPGIVGADLTDYMTSATTGNMLAMENMLRQAQFATVQLKIDENSLELDDNRLTAEVSVTNLTGHRFPSGVAFRRAFIEFLVLDDDQVIWGSGRTNSIGLIVDREGKPLETEFLEHQASGNHFPSYQPHYQAITSEDQVQIYEELVLNANSEFTTSFIHRIAHVKDNRLLPKGWVPGSQFSKDQGEVIAEFMAATDPEGPSVIGGEPWIGPRPLPNNLPQNMLPTRTTLTLGSAPTH